MRTLSTGFNSEPGPVWRGRYSKFSVIRLTLRNQDGATLCLVGTVEGNAQAPMVPLEDLEPDSVRSCRPERRFLKTACRHKPLALKKERPMRKSDRIKPAVTKTVLLFLAGFVWFCVGTMLLVLAYSWLSNATRTIFFAFFGVGIGVALLVHHFGFLKIVDKNIDRIRPMVEKKCLFSFITWKSYMIIMVMVAMGTSLRHSAIPKQYLAIVYTGIGLALILSSLRYIRVFVQEIKKA